MAQRHLNGAQWTSVDAAPESRLASAQKAPAPTFGRSEEVDNMASEHTVADNIVYDLISIQYHALKAAEVYDRFLEDAHSSEHADVAAFIQRCKDEDEQRAISCHEFLVQLTRSGIG
jgi:hypothetical protein